METLFDGGIFNTLPILSDEQGIMNSGDCVEPVSSRLHPTFFHHSLSVLSPDILKLQSSGAVQNLLESGAASNDALYISEVNDVACTNLECNKRISVAGQEWSAGRPGNRPIGAREAAHNSEICLGPYATHNTVQPHAGHNTRDSREASSTLPDFEISTAPSSQQQVL